MGFQVIKQPDGQLAIFSTEKDEWVCWDGTPEEVVDWFAERAAAEARQRAGRAVQAVVGGTPEKIYYQSAMTFAEANTHHQAGNGAGMPGPEGPVDAELLAELERPLEDADCG